jgi:hypothetical protein
MVRGRPHHRVVSLLPSPLAPTGGVFRLDRKPPTDISRSITRGWSAFARPGGQYLIVSGPHGTADYDTALEDTIGAAQEGLDLIAAGGGPALTIEGAETGHIVWWTDTRGIVLRDMAIEDLTFRFSLPVRSGTQQGTSLRHPHLRLSHGTRAFGISAFPRRREIYSMHTVTSISRSNPSSAPSCLCT